MRRKYAFMVDLGDGLFGGKAYALSVSKTAAVRQFLYGGLHCHISEIQRIPRKELEAARKLA